MHTLALTVDVHRRKIARRNAQTCKFSSEKFLSDRGVSMDTNALYVHLNIAELGTARKYRGVIGVSLDFLRMSRARLNLQSLCLCAVCMMRCDARNRKTYIPVPITALQLFREFWVIHKGIRIRPS